MKNPNKRKSKKAIIISAIVFLAVVAYFCIWGGHKKYDFPLNTIETIRYFEPVHKQVAYRAILLTPTEYWRTPFSNTLIAKAVYKDDTIGIKIQRSRTGKEIVFKSIGKESDNFVKAIAGLYEENATGNTAMRPEMKGIYWNGEAGFVNWHWWGNDSYKITMAGLDNKKAEILLDIDVPHHTIHIGDKNNGLSKKRFVNAFRQTNEE